MMMDYGKVTKTTGKMPMTKEELEVAKLRGEIDAARKQGSPIGKLWQKYWRLKRRLPKGDGMALIEHMEKGREKIRDARDKYDKFGGAMRRTGKKYTPRDDWAFDIGQDFL